jgi:hypothetical protein
MGTKRQISSTRAGILSVWSIADIRIDTAERFLSALEPG